MAASLDDGQIKNVLRQVEFYFSESNFPRDKFLKKSVQESEDGLVSLALICSFTPMRTHLGLGNLKPEEVPEETLLAVAETLRKSSALKVSEDGKRVGRSTELSKPEDVIEQVDSRTISASPLPHDVKIEDVESFFPLPHDVKIEGVESFFGQHAKMDGTGPKFTQGEGSRSTREELLREILLVQRQQLYHAREGPQPRVGTMSDFLGLAPPTFDGTEGPIAAEEWLRETEDLLVAADIPVNDRAKMVKVQLRGVARTWWDVMSEQFLVGAPWVAFKEMFLTQYFPPAVKAHMEQQFVTLQQGSMTVEEYFVEFTRLSRYAPALVMTDDARRDKFIQGLSIELQSLVEPHSEATFQRVVEAAKRQQYLRAQISGTHKRPAEVLARSSRPVVAKRPQFTQSRPHFTQQRPHYNQQHHQQFQ